MALYKPNKVEADNIRKLRTENALSQEQFAAIIKEELSKNDSQAAIKARTIQNYESGLYSIPLIVRTAIKDRFGVEIKDAPAPEPMRETFRKRLVKAREKKGLEASTLARLSGCRQYQYYEAGKYIPKLEHFDSICSALGASPDYLLGLKDGNSLKERRSGKAGSAAACKPEAGEGDMGNTGRQKLLEFFPTKLRAAREGREMPVHSAAKLTGCPEFAKYEKGESLPSLESLYKICKNLGVSSDRLLGAGDETIENGP